MNTTYTTLAARVLLALLFIVAGLGKLGDVAGFTGYMVSGGIPAIFAWPTILLEVPGTLSVGTAPRSGGCTFQEAMLREFIRQLLGVVGTVEHVRCRSREEGACEWRAEWRTIR